MCDTSYHQMVKLQSVSIGYCIIKLVERLVDSRRAFHLNDSLSRRSSDAISLVRSRFCNDVKTRCSGFRNASSVQTQLKTLT